MNRPCDKVELFVDGELPLREADAFRDHIADCANCQREMTSLMQLKLLGHNQVERVGVRVPEASPSFFSRLGSWKFWGIAALAAPALALLVLMLANRSTQVTPREDVWLVQRPKRLLEARVSHPGADRYRPLGPVMMGGTKASEGLPHGDMALLEEHDPHGVVAVYLVRSNEGLAAQALAELEKLGQSPDLASDRAVALMLLGDNQKALWLLEEVLQKNPRHPQALWNRGLLLSKLHLHQQAAQAFSEVAALKEPGWSEEATARAEALNSSASERRLRWRKGSSEGQALLDKVPATPSEAFVELPSARRHFYEAVRGVRSREQALALLPLAQQLDKKAGGSVLERYVRRVSEADFSRRAPLSQGYLALLKKQLSSKELEELLARLLASKEDDLLLGVLVQAEVAGRYLELYEAKALASGDPWFQLLAAQERARSQANWKLAAKTLQDARGLCTGAGLEYRCIYLERELSSLYIKHHQLDLARRHAQEGWDKAQKLSEWQLESGLLWNLAVIARLSGDTWLARAYLMEFLARDGEDSDTARRAHQELAAMAIQQLQVDEARKEIDAALATDSTLGLPGVFALVEISRLKRSPGDEKHLTQTLEKLTPRLSPGEQVIATHILGRFYIEQDVEKGRSLLWRAIKEAEALKPAEDTGARRARAYSFTSLLFEAGKRGDFPQAVELLERERQMALPGSCLLMASADSERFLFMVRGSDGKLAGHYDDSWRKALPQNLEGLVPEALVAALRPCEQVEVLARPPLHSGVALLPPEMAWSYLTRSSPPRARRPGPAVHLVVSEVDLPPEANLEPLNAWSASFGPEEQRKELSGAQATPSRVLEAMKDATEIDLVTHGILDAYVDSSYLVMAPGQEGWELSEAEVRGAALQGAPFVVLAACHAAHSTSSVDAPLSLPAAFIEAGARGVLAATVQIPDQEAQDFFNAVRERMRSGTAPAQALRDERMKWQQEKKGGDWLHSVLLFE
jgi:hypothetical protein